MTKQSWFTTNVKEISLDRSKQLEVNLHPYKFKPLTFEQATLYTIDQLVKRHGKLYVTLSGGFDSTYIVEQLYRNKVDFEPVIVDNPWTKSELAHAYYWCYSHKIKPLVININEVNYLKTFAEIYKRWGNCDGIGLVSVIYAGLKLQDKGHLVTGTTLLDDEEADPRIIKAFCSWDYYYTLFDLNFELFYMDNLQIVDSIFNSVQDHHTRTDYFKTELYQIPFRSKINIQDEKHFAPIANALNKFPRIRVKDEGIYINFEKFKAMLKECYV